MRGGRSGGRGFGGGRHSGGGQNGGYRNPCLTMHQPWASLLVAGIKRVEGRSWPSPVTGRLWIHAAGKVPDPDTVAAMEAFYREIHAVDGVAAIEFPQHYPVSRLLGCVEVVGCVRSEELVCWEDVPESVRLEGLTDFCWLCENPQKLVVPFEMRGNQGVYNLERRIYEGAVRGLSPVQGPLPIKFPLPDPRNPFSLKPGSLNFDSSKSVPAKTPSVSAAIAGARAAANQYTRKGNSAAAASSEIQTRHKSSLNPSPAVQNTPSYSRNQNPASIIANSPPHLQIQNRSAAATSSEVQTWSKSREEDRADSSSGTGSLPSAVQDSPSHSQRQNPPSIVHAIPSYPHNIIPVSIVGSIPIYSQSQDPMSIVHAIPSYPHNQIPVSIVGSIPIYAQGQNPPSIVHAIPSYPHTQIPVSIVGSIPIYSQGQNPPTIVRNITSYSQNQNSPSVLQNQNPEPRRSPRLQSGASNRLVAAALRDLKQASSSEGKRDGWVPKSRPG